MHIVVFDSSEGVRFALESGEGEGKRDRLPVLSEVHQVSRVERVYEG